MKTSPYLLLTVELFTAFGCSDSKPNPMRATDEPLQTQKDTAVSSTKTVTQTLHRGGSKFCEITDKGEVWINSDKRGSIEANGEIWVAGEKLGSIESNGEVWKAGNKIGDITANLDIWYEGNKIGEIESDGTVWHNGDSIGSTSGGDPRKAAGVFFFGFFND